jgi:hypothetical protein
MERNRRASTHPRATNFAAKAREDTPEEFRDKYARA